MGLCRRLVPEGRYDSLHSAPHVAHVRVDVDAEVAGVRDRVLRGHMTGAPSLPR
jgi:hypothetical protein